MPYPRARNQSALRTSDLVSGLSDRVGSPHSENRSSAYQTPSFQPPSARDLQSSLASLKSSREARPSNKTPLRLANLEESANNARSVHTLSQVEAPSFFSKSNKVSEAGAPLTPIHRLPPSPLLPNVEFKKAYDYNASVKGKPILDTRENPISKTTWSIYKPAQKEEAIKRALVESGSGKKQRGKGKKNNNEAQEYPLLYDSDRNDLWA